MTQILINFIVFSFFSLILLASIEERECWWQEGNFHKFLFFIFVFLELATGGELLKIIF